MILSTGSIEHALSMCIQRSLWTYSLLSLISKIYHSFSCYFQSRAAIVASVTRLSQVLLKGLDDKLSYDRSSNIWWLFWLLLKGLGDQFPYKSSPNICWLFFGYFWKVKVTNFLTKVAQISVDFLGFDEKHLSSHLISHEARYKGTILMEEWVKWHLASIGIRYD